MTGRHALKLRAGEIEAADFFHSCSQPEKTFSTENAAQSFLEQSGESLGMKRSPGVVTERRNRLIATRGFGIEQLTPARTVYCFVEIEGCRLSTDPRRCIDRTRNARARIKSLRDRLRQCKIGTVQEDVTG